MMTTPIEIIRQAIGRIVGEGVEFVVEHPADEKHGDYATNAALVLARPDGISPRQIAEKLVVELKKDKGLEKIVADEKIQIAGPGFINFWLRDEWLVAETMRIVKEGDDYGKSEWGRGRRVLVEYSSPNIAKLFSVGHLRSTIIGQAIYNLYKALGWEVVSDNHLGDWGTQFGMIIAAVEEKGVDITSLSVEEIEGLYVDISKRSEDNPSLRERAKEAFARLEKGESAAREIWKKAVDISMVEFDRIYRRLGVKIDHAFGESAYERMMPAIIEEAKKRGFARESEGAWIIEFPDLPPAMLLKSDGTTTYFTRDLATIKFREGNPDLKSDLYVYEVGAEQSLHFQQVFAAAELFGWGRKGDFVHVGHGLILGEDGKKMSTRKGTTLKLEVWLDEMVGKASEINEQTAAAVGIGAVKFNDLKHAPSSNYVFSLEEALSLEGASGPYLQYTYARSMSVLAKAGMGVKDLEATMIDLNEEELAVLRKLTQFGGMLSIAAKSFSPNLLCAYVLDLTQRFNTFYNKHTILGAETDVRNFRLVLTAAVAQVIKNTLVLLGIEPLEKM